MTLVANTVPLPADWRDFLTLTKPRVMTLVIFTAICGLLAAPGGIHPVLGFTAILAIAMGAGGSAALNHWWEADLDAGMKRTASRPLPSGRMRREDARDFGLFLSVKSVTQGNLFDIADNLIVKDRRIDVIEHRHVDFLAGR